jgi:hypothetical protein
MQCMHEGIYVKAVFEQMTVRSILNHLHLLRGCIIRQDGEWQVGRQSKERLGG